MRYAVVIEKAESNYSAYYVPDLAVALRRAPLWTRSSARFAQQSNSISKDCAPTVSLCRRRPA